MSTRHYRLPAFTMLVAFEAAARHGSFKRAAEELAVTPGAISHQIRSLETDLAVDLFHRRHRGVTLTPQGDLLLTTLQQSFTDIARTVKALRQHSENRPVTIAATTAMSSLWLTPRITAFWRHHSDVMINQHVSDAPVDSPADGPIHSDLRIRYGAPQSGSHCRIPLFRDTLVPVCSPGFASRHRGADLGTLAGLPLIHLDADQHRWTDWPAWFAAQQHKEDCRHGIRVNNYIIALQLAREGLGVVLGWRALIEPLLERGSLVVLGDCAIAAPDPFFIEYESDATLTGNARLLCDWLSGQT